MNSGSRFWLFFMYFLFIFTFGFLITGVYLIGKFNTGTFFQFGYKEALEDEGILIGDTELFDENGVLSAQDESDGTEGAGQTGPGIDDSANGGGNDIEGMQPTDVIGNEGDYGGGSAELSEKEQIESELRRLFSEKYEIEEDSIIVGVSKYDETHASGGVTFGSEISGGWFLAARADGEWIIVQDGNGVISCQLIAPYDFPGYMVPECYDFEENVSVSRSGPGLE